MFFKKKEEKTMTLDEILKAYAELSEEDKAKFDEALDAAEEEAEKQGEKPEEKPEEKPAETAPEVPAPAEEPKEAPAQEEKPAETDFEKSVKDSISMLLARIEALENKDKIDDKREKYGLSPAPVAGNGNKEYSDADVDRLLGK